MGGDHAKIKAGYRDEMLKSTPPAWAGTVFAKAIDEALKCLNPPRPHGRGHGQIYKLTGLFYA